MNLKVTKIVSVTSHVEATVNELQISGEVRVRNNSTIEGIDGGNVKDASGNQLASFSYYGSSNLNVNYNNTENGNVATIASNINDYIKELEANPSIVTTITSSNED